ncbi:MAG: M20/M25/M40 family metallo-hydrolase [Deltaproteobacteria bacterium]|nr:M20/M25/M40 family metallo-hydrolase [bacterium]MCB9489761.1 M20/M25/M40 family metallo-hydrolase [Deltaproteobacteria bacterium]
MTIPDPIELLTAMIKTPSITGDTHAVQDVVAQWLVTHGVREVVSDGDGITARVGPKDKPPLLLISHVDTVPVGEGWTVDPFGAEARDNLLYGRGSTDAGGAASAMAAATAALAQSGDVPVLLFLSADEEGEWPKAHHAVPRFGEIAAAVVGEPTELNVGVSQRGLMVVELICRGMQGHAAHVEEPSTALLLAQDVARVGTLPFHETDVHLGGVKITPVRLSAGVADNVTPPVATALFDIRTIPAYGHDDIMERIRHAARHCEVRKVGCDWPAVRTPEGHPILDAALSVTGGQALQGKAASDWAFLGDIPAVKIGPGDTRISHQPDEHVPMDQVRRAAEVYVELARRLSAGGDA